MAQNIIDKVSTNKINLEEKEDDIKITLSIWNN